jgi:hypothetical protein
MHPVVVRRDAKGPTRAVPSKGARAPSQAQGGVPIEGTVDLPLALTLRTSVRLAMQALLEGRSAESIVEDALASYWPKASS